MATFDRETFTDYELEDDGLTIILRSTEDVYKIPVRHYARATKIMVGSTVVLERALP